MSNKTSNHLFDLIKSLNKTEKRAFRLYTSRHTIGEQNSSIELYDYIDKMDIYDEPAIFEHFKGSAFLNKFSITKGRLYNNILKSLDLYYSSQSIEAQIYKTIHAAEILFNKGLYQQSSKQLQSAEKQALKNGKNIILLEIKNKQKKLIEKESYSVLKKNQLQNIFKEEQHILNEIGKQQTLWLSKSLLFNEINQKGIIRSVEDISTLERIIDDIKNIDIENSSDHVKYLYHHVYSAYYFAIKDVENCKIHLIQSKQIFQNNNTFIEHSPGAYFSIITNLVYVCTKLKQFKEGTGYLNELKAIPNSKNYHANMDADLKFFSSIYSLELFLKMEQHDYAGAKKLIPEITEGYVKFGDKINSIRKAYLDFKIATVYMSVGEFDEALNWINKILNAQGFDKKQDIYCFAQILSLILHFELKNLRLLPYTLNSTKRYLKGRNRLFKFEELFLKTIGKISKKELNQFDIEEILIPLSKELYALKNDPFEQTVFDYFDFATWVKSKIENKPFKDLMLAS